MTEVIRGLLNLSLTMVGRKIISCIPKLLSCNASPTYEHLHMSTNLHGIYTNTSHKYSAHFTRAHLTPGILGYT